MRSPPANKSPREKTKGPDPREGPGERRPREANAHERERVASSVVYFHHSNRRNQTSRRVARVHPGGGVGENIVSRAGRDGSAYPKNFFSEGPTTRFEIVFKRLVPVAHRLARRRRRLASLANDASKDPLSPAAPREEGAEEREEGGILRDRYRARAPRRPRGGGSLEPAAPRTRPELPPDERRHRPRREHEQGVQGGVRLPRDVEGARRAPADSHSSRLRCGHHSSEPPVDEGCGTTTPARFSSRRRKTPRAARHLNIA